MPSNKDRLYVALYFHEREGAYHWAYLVSPVSNPNGPNRTTRYHVTNRLVDRGEGTPKLTWEYEQSVLEKVKTAKLLVKILIGKIESSRKEFEASMQKVPIVQDDPEWRCRTWTRNIVRQLVQDGILSKSSITGWTYIEAESRAYVTRKEKEGRFRSWTETVPTYDLTEKREIIS